MTASGVGRAFNAVVIGGTASLASQGGNSNGCPIPGFARRQGFTAGDIDGPDGLAFDGAHIWVTNAGGNSVMEFNAMDGSLVGIFAAGDDIKMPCAFAFDGARICVANAGGNSVDKL